MTQSKTVSLVEALELVVDGILQSYSISGARHPEMRAVLLQVASASATLVVNHFEKNVIPQISVPPVPDATPPASEPLAAVLPWKKPDTKLH